MLGLSVDETFDDFLAAASSGIAGVEGRAVLATLAGGKGPLGRRALFLAGGTVLGSVTLGGCAEGAVRRAAAETQQAGRAQLLDINLGDEDAYELGMACAGRAAVQLSPLTLPSRLWGAAARARQAGETLRLVTPLGAGGVPFALTETGAVLADGTPDAALVAEAAQLSPQQERRERRGPVLFETRLPPPELVIVGAGPIAPPLCRMGRTLGLRITVCDDRPERLTAGRLPDASALLLSRPDEPLRLPPLSAHSSVVIISHDYAQEVPALRWVLAASVPYVALVASRRRGRAVLEFLRDTGTPPAELARVRTPAGLQLHAETPAGIALSILAEVVALRCGGDGQPLSRGG